MKSTSFKLCALAILTFLMLGCAAQQPAADATANQSWKTGNGLATAIH